MHNEPPHICVKPAVRAQMRLDRPLTEGEIAMARSLFGDAVDYARIFSRRYLPFGMRPRNCAMSPNGSIYFHKSCCLPDFSRGDAHARHWFMLEMVLVCCCAHRVLVQKPRSDIPKRHSTTDGPDAIAGPKIEPNPAPIWAVLRPFVLRRVAAMNTLLVSKSVALLPAARVWEVGA
ncbi:hypothetical protein [Massilia cavernae]|uniref:hypothetical protein n=1 Tax=Massilia cavernae TaxID=2320864 RepID=UPI001C7241D2|nr:hypothetical protein [Massilia cavernae]